jgi:hypothetical protein
MTRTLTTSTRTLKPSTLAMSSLLPSTSEWGTEIDDTTTGIHLDDDDQG